VADFRYNGQIILKLIVSLFDEGLEATSIRLLDCADIFRAGRVSNDGLIHMIVTMCARKEVKESATAFMLMD
jgi:hypothetical protein